MILSALQFLIATIFTIVAAYVAGLSEGDIQIIAFLIPALWLLPKSGFSSVVMLAAMGILGLTLPLQPVALSISQWVLIPLLMVAFSPRSNLGVILVSALIVLTLQVGIMVTQSAGKLEGSPMVTVVQIVMVMLIWWAARGWKPSHAHSWWALILVIPLWVAEQFYAATLALLITGIIAACEYLVPKATPSLNWGTLLGWSLPCVSFATLVVSPATDVPKPVFVVWICILATAWTTDYVLKSTEEAPE
ncbi:hypothetical protein [Vibrio tarriae]|uniref:hypothetical protein n=1 Tax=Vibrio tarriae TaxID=2014742 RepID=UPI000DE3CB1F|nr:hypothetical protein [Vibrio tarriae]QEO46401.1 hypothetical protein F0315_14325 [Vibrio cholerae]RBM30404.1 hypothetical protein DLR61_07170 [Vibrio tarriae]RBM37246.1 hypothetical protein DLR58_00910 [Vibrio tarriae]RBM46756.1 hypothetical protein DLR64_17305 [Vibrio tarriae]